MFPLRPGSDGGRRLPLFSGNSYKDNSTQALEKKHSKSRVIHGEKKDLREELQEKREDRSRDVWKRIDPQLNVRLPRYRERYHPYSKSYKEQSFHYNSSSKARLEWRPRREGPSDSNIEGRQHDGNSLGKTGETREDEKNKSPEERDADMEFEQRLDRELVEMEMDDEMIDNNELLLEDLEDYPEKIDAISQLSPELEDDDRGASWSHGIEKTTCHPGKSLPK
ncbi:unnamed protein product, partial [Thlaspi arvense]